MQSGTSTNRSNATTIHFSQLFDATIVDTATVLPQPENKHLMGITFFYVFSRLVILFGFIALAVWMKVRRRRGRTERMTDMG